MRLRYLWIWFLCILCLKQLVSSQAAFALQPPRPGEIADLKKSGRYADRLEKALALGNHKIDKNLVDRAIYKAKRQAIIQQGGKPDEILPAPPPADKLVPTKGTVKFFALAIDFTDYPGYSTQAQIQSALFGDGSLIPGNLFPYESLQKFYERSSYNQLDLSQGVALPWYHAPYTRDQVPQTTEGRQNLIKEAIAWHKANGSLETGDFTQFDNDGNGQIEYFIVLWTGPAGDWATFWWGYKTGWYDTTYTVDGKTLGVYSWQWEGDYGNPGLVNPHTVIHETGHGLGLPDYYDYDDTVGPNGGVGGLDIMDGTWGDHNCYSKWVLDWITPTVVATGSQTITLNPSETSKDAVLIMPGAISTDAFREFFLVQNRYRTGTGNDQKTAVSGYGAYPADGMLIWHVDARLNAAGTDWLYNNQKTGHKMLKLMQADGLDRIEKYEAPADAAMYFPGTTNNTNFGPLTTPNSRDYLGVDSRVNVTNISASWPQMTATFSIDNSSTLATLTVARTGIGSGTVTGDDPTAISCGSDCAESYVPAKGTVVTLTAVPAPGSKFTGWSGGGCSGTGTCQVTMTADTTVTANFDTILVLNEDFDPVSSSFPSGWSKVITAGGANWWYTYTNYNTTGGTGGCALGATSGTGPFDAELRTFALDLSTYNTVGLEFKTSVENSSETADVDVSLNGASGPWTNVWRKVGRFTGPQTVNVDLTSAAAGHNNVMLRFHHSGTGVWWVIDDVKVMASAPAINTTTAVSSDVNPSTYGQPVAFTATVSTTSATGTITFKDGTATLGTGTLSGGQATYGTSALSVGSHSITAVYGGDSNYNGSTSAVLTQTVNPAPSFGHLAITAPSSQTAGAAFSVTVTAQDVNNNILTGYTGTVHFASTDGQATLPSDYTFTADDNGSHTFTGIMLKTAGAHTLSATDAAATSTSSANVTVIPGSAVAFTVTTPPSGAAGSYFDVTVTAKDAFNNTATGYAGTVHFTTTDAHAGITLPSDYSFSASDNGSKTFSSGAAFETAGNQTITATDTTTASIAGTSGSILITPAAATLFSVTAPPTATAGMAFSITVTAKDTFDNVVTGYTGTVHFTSTDSNGSVVLPSDYTFAASDNGVHTFSGMTLATAGTQTVTATDTVTSATGGTSGSIAVSSGAASKLVFGQQPTNFAIGQKITPAVTVRINDAYGNLTTSTAAVTLAIGTNPGSGTLSGTTTQNAVDGIATFSDLAIDNTGSGYTLTASSANLTGTISNVFDTTSTTQTITVDTHAPTTAPYNSTFTVTAHASSGLAVTITTSGSCSGNGSNSALVTMTSGTGGCTVHYNQAGSGAYTAAPEVTETTVATKLTATTAIVSSLNPSAFGQPVTFTATVSPSTATGTVTFMDGSTTLGTETLSGGSAAISISTLSAGSHSVTAAYSGDSNNSGSTSSTITQTVNSAAGSVTVASSLNPSIIGQLVTFTATVSPSTATGRVTFKDGLNSLVTVTISGGTATYRTSSLRGGSHSITAVYSGDSKNSGSTSAAIIQTVNKVASTTTVASSLNPSIFRQPATFTATISPSTVTGRVTFKDGLNSLGTVTISGGKATYRTSLLSAGNHSITAVYSGDSKNSDSTSAAITQTVNKATSRTTVASSLHSSTFGKPVTFTATVSPSTATGTVIFYDGSSVLGTVTISGGRAAYSTSSLSVGSHSITAVYSGDSSYGSSTSSVLTQKVIVPDLTITSSHKGSILHGQTRATYTITVSNIGTGPTSGTVTVTDILPTGLTATAISGIYWNCTLSTLTCTRRSVLPAGYSYSPITLTVKVANDASSGSNTATVSGGGEVDTTNDMATDPTVIN